MDTLFRYQNTSLLQVKLGWGVAGASWAYCVATLVQLTLLITYVIVSGRASTVFGWPCRAALQVPTGLCVMHSCLLGLSARALHLSGASIAWTQPLHLPCCASEDLAASSMVPAC